MGEKAGGPRAGRKGRREEGREMGATEDEELPSTSALSPLDPV